MWFFTERNEIIVSKIYEGRSINKLQNDVILLVFKIYLKNPKYVFCREFLSTSYEFYYDDITVMLFINIKIGDVAVKSIP